MNSGLHVRIVQRVMRGDEVLVLTAQVENTARLHAIIRSAQTIICDQASLETIKAAIQQLPAAQRVPRHASSAKKAGRAGA